MRTTRKMLDEAVGMGCGADGPSVQVGVDACKEPGPDAYDDLRDATPEELLEAVIWWYRQSLNPPEMIELAISLEIEQYNNWTEATMGAEIDGDE